MDGSQKKIYFEKLDSLRFLCFLSVFFYHSFYTESVSIKDSDVYNFLAHGLFINGNLGVNFFFVLSGFLITYLLIKEKEVYGQIHLRKFWIRRILRIWPLYLACVLFGFVVFPELKSLFGQEPNETANPLYYVLFISNFDIIKNGLPDASVLGVLWSVAIEEQFYLLWPLILFIIPLKRYWVIFLLIIVQSVVFRFYNPSFIMGEYHTLSCIGDMACGALMGWMMAMDRWKSWFENWPRILILISYLAFILFYFFRTDISSLSEFIGVLDRLVIALLISIIIADQSFSKKPLMDFSKIPQINRLGQISYGLYCLHFVGILAVLKITSLAGVNDKLWHVVFLEPTLSLIVTIVLAELSYRILETPFLRLKKKFSFFVAKT